jgi:hypothetical protein
MTLCSRRLRKRKRKEGCARHSLLVYFSSKFGSVDPRDRENEQ